MGKFNVLSIADIHIGSRPAKLLFNELNQFLDYFKNIKKCDLVVINGDFYDRKLSLNEENSKLAIEFIEKDLLNIAKEKNTKIRMIKGTKSHDLYQLEVFKYLESETKGLFKVINNITEEEIQKNLYILYVPEEYIENQYEYYTELYNDNDECYDMGFFHGTFDFTAFTNQKQDSERAIKNAPIFNFKQIEKKFLGPIICGHIHNRTSYKKKVFYSGSFSRWCFGEEKPKGFLHIIYDTESYDYKIKFIENKLAPIYVTLNLDDEWINIKNLSIDDKIKFIEEYKNQFDNQEVHIRVNLDKNKFINESDIDLIREYFSDKEDFKINLKEDIVRILQESEDNKKEQEYEFILKKQVPLPEILKKYIKKNFNKDISLDKIKDLLFQEK